MERIFQISAVILGGVAAYFLWTGYKDGAFVAAVLGAVSFFLSIRVQVKGRLNERERERLALEDEELLRLEEAEESIESMDFETEREDIITENRK
jgi:hypothetical protein